MNTREIKFRAWDNVDKRLVKVHGISFDEHIITLTDKDGDYAERLFIEVELMQYTGLTDKNGVEIYEGDLVLHGRSVYVYETNNLNEVVWVQAMSCWKLRNRDKASDADDDWLSKSYTLEVIGNIYENPELLK